MAKKKKNEFKPDKPYSNWLSKLYITQKQRKSLLKWMLYALVLLMLSLLQDIVLCDVRLMGATTELVPCGIFLICLLEGGNSGSVFALIASLCYTFSGSAPSAFSVVPITALAVFVTLFRQSYLQKGFLVAMICCVVAMVLYELVTFAFGAFFGYTLWSRFYGFLITAALSLIAAPVLYPICLAIGTIGGETWKE